MRIDHNIVVTVFKYRYMWLQTCRFHSLILSTSDEPNFQAAGRRQPRPQQPRQWRHHRRDVMVTCPSRSWSAAAASLRDSLSATNRCAVYCDILLLFRWLWTVPCVNDRTCYRWVLSNRSCFTVAAHIHMHFVLCAQQTQG